MTDTHSTQTEPDDGFTAEERTQFESMRTESPRVEIEHGPPTVPDAPASTGAPAPVQGTPPVGGAPTDAPDDDDDDETPLVPAQGDPSAPSPRAPRRVSYSKFHRTEKQLIDALAKLSEREQTQARLDERLRILNEALTTPTPSQQQAPVDQDPEPDPEADIFGHNAWLKRQLVRTQESIRDMQEGSRQAATANQVHETYLSDAQGFASKEPNFLPAYQFLMTSRITELAEYFFGKDMTAEGAMLTPQELSRIRSTISDEERQLVTTALRSGKSPAQRVFSIAKARGFRPPAAAPSPSETNGRMRSAMAAAKTNGAGNGAAAPTATPGSLAAAPAANGNGSSTVRDEVERIRSGADASLSLSNGGGASPVTLTAEKLANMPQDEFNELVDRMSPAEIKRLMGG